MPATAVRPQLIRWYNILYYAIYNHSFSPMDMTMNLLLQIFGLVLLIAGVYVGYHQWIMPHRDELDWRGVGLMLLIVLMLMGGFIGSPFWWLDEARSFSWDLPPLASRMLAAAGWSFFVLGVLVLAHPTDRRLRLAVLLLFVYLVPLAVAAPLFHLDRFDFSEPIVIAFFGIVILMVAGTLYFLLRQPVIFPDDAADLAPPSQATRVWLIIVAVVTSLWGVALLVTDSGPSDLIWVWPGDLLTSRLIGVMLLTIAVGSIYSMPAIGTARPMLVMIMVYALGLSLATLWNALAGKPVKLSYAIVFGIIFVGSGVVLLGNRKQKTEGTEN